MNSVEDKESIEVEAPRTLFSNEEEGSPNQVEKNVNDNDNIPQQKAWYSKTIGKVAILFLAVFAVCIAIGYGSGYGINEKIHSNKAAASVSSAKNVDFMAYDESGPSSKTSKSSSEGTKAAKSDTKSAKCTVGNGAAFEPCCDASDCNNNCECVPCEDGAPPTCDGGYSCNNNRLLIYGDEENEPIEEDIPSYRRLKIIQDVGAKDDATFSVKHELISVESCDALVKHMEDAFTSGIDVPVRKGVKDDFESWVLHGDNADELYHKKLHANELVDLIGKDDTENIIDMFYDSFGDVPIDTMYLVRVGLPTGGLDWHKDSYDSLEITLNDNYEGGDVFHMTALGIHKSNERRGTAIAHKDDIAHGVTPNNGVKYTLILKHHPHSDHKKGVVRLSKEMLGEL